MNPPILVIYLGDLVGLACALLGFALVGVYALVVKITELSKKRKNRQ